MARPGGTTHGEYKFGIEEELFLADRRSRTTPKGSVSDFHRAAARRVDSAERELLQNQVEICTKPSASFAEARETLSRLRERLAEVGREHGLLVFAAGTHPTALWSEQRETAKTRYQTMMRDLQIVGRRSVVCGMHVHVEVPRPEARVDLMRRLSPFLPMLLALSASSPFFEKQRTGLMGYRLRAYAELPRTGLPELFEDGADYERYVAVMTEAGAVEDPSYFWWHVRPSTHYPTLELRVADSCTRLDDGLAVAALFRCLVRLLDRRADIHERLTGASRGLVMENLWRAERKGVQASLIDEASARAVPVRQAVDALLDLIGEDAVALGCEAECAHARTVVQRGSSADGQLAAFEAALAQGRSERQALNDVVDWLAAVTT